MTSQISVQFDTPDAGAVGGVEGAVRSVGGVSSATTTSLALGGVSVMAVTYNGTIDSFRAALQARGWQVIGAGSTLRIRRATQSPPPEMQPDNAAIG